MEALARGLKVSGIRDLRLDRNGIDVQGACALVKVGSWVVIVANQGGFMGRYRRD